MIDHIYIVEGMFKKGEDSADAPIIRMIKPSPEEVIDIQSRYQLPEDFLTAANDPDEQPRLESVGNHHLMVLRIPYKRSPEDGQHVVPYQTIAFGIIILPDRLITVCSETTLLWRVLLNSHRKIVNSSFPDLINLLLIQCARMYLRDLKSIENDTGKIEKEIRESLRNDSLFLLMDLEKCIVHFTTSLRENAPVLTRYARAFYKNLTKRQRMELDDVKIEFKQAQNLSDIQRTILGNMTEVFASIISNKLNVVMKFLASITIIFMIPTLIASLYGMNIELPLQHSPHAFFWIMAICILFSGGGIALFLKSKLF